MAGKTVRGCLNSHIILVPLFLATGFLEKGHYRMLRTRRRCPYIVPGTIVQGASLCGRHSPHSTRALAQE